jgi:hypothetical protein
LAEPVAPTAVTVISDLHRARVSERVGYDITASPGVRKNLRRSSAMMVRTTSKCQSLQAPHRCARG